MSGTVIETEQLYITVWRLDSFLVWWSCQRCKPLHVGNGCLCRKDCPSHSLLASLEVSKRIILVQLAASSWVLRCLVEQVEQQPCRQCVGSGPWGNSVYGLLHCSSCFGPACFWERTSPLWGLMHSQSWSKQESFQLFTRFVWLEDNRNQTLKN